MIPPDILGMKRREKFLRRAKRRRKRGVRTLNGMAFKLLTEPDIKKRPFILLWLLMLLLGHRITKEKARA